MYIGPLENIEDQDEMQHNVAFHQGSHELWKIMKKKLPCMEFEEKLNNH